MIDTEVLTVLGRDAGARITDAYRRMIDAGAPDGTIRQVLTDMLMSGRAAATVDGEAMALRQIEELGIDVAPNALRPSNSKGARHEAAVAVGRERERYSSAVSTMLADDDLESVTMRLERMARSEAIDAAQTTSGDLMRRTSEVDGWIRQRDADPCELCDWWWRAGRVWPAGHTMPTHKGCACAQQWVRAAEISVRQTSAQTQVESARRAQAGTLDERRTMHETDYSSTATRGEKR